MLTTSIAIRLFGVPSVTSSPNRTELHVAPKAFSVLAHVLLHRDAPAPRDTVAFTVWPDESEENARANLRRMIYVLQRSLPRDDFEWLILERRTIRWNVDAPYWLDVAEYERLRSADRLAEAVELYSGDLLSPLEDEWIQTEREKYREQHVRLLGALVEQHRERHAYARAIEYAKMALRIDPLREDLVRTLIALRSESGDRAGALRTYQSFAADLRRELNAEPMAETRKILSEIQTPALHGSVPDAPGWRQTELSHNLPSTISSFVGRTAELSELSELCAGHRLVTLVGPGGVGKTRLALALAEHVIEHYADGIRLIDIAPVTEPGFFLQAVAAALDLDDLEGRNLSTYIVDQLRRKHVLLILDNCDRMIATSAEFVRHLLTRCPRVCVLATSRELLSVSGEVVYEVMPLSIPRDSESEPVPQDLMEYDAVRLLCQRVSAAYPKFALTDDNAAAVGAICRHLDGIPLAIELAASRARALSPAQILERLDDRFSLLQAGGRVTAAHQQTMRGTIDWSYALLDAREREVLPRLAVFRGSFSLEAVRAVCPVGSDDDTVDVLTRLVDKSLVVTVIRPDEHRYRLLETIREYLVEKLRESNDFEGTRVRHLDYFTRLAERLEPQLVTAEQARAMTALIEENDNLRAALDWPVTQPEAKLLRLRLIGALRWYYWFRGFLAEGRANSAAALECGEPGSAAYAKALSTHGFCALQQGDMPAATASLEAALKVYGQSSQHDREAVLTEIHAGMAAAFSGNHTLAVEYLERALGTARKCDDSWLLAYALGSSGLHAALRRDREKSIALLRESVTLSEAARETFQGTFWLLNLAIEEYQESPDYARELFAQCADRGTQQRNERVIAGAFEGLAWCLQRRGQNEVSARFLGSAEALRSRKSQALLLQWQQAHADVQAALSRTLGESLFAQEMANGARFVREASIDELRQILEEGDRSGTASGLGPGGA